MSVIRNPKVIEFVAGKDFVGDAKRGYVKYAAESDFDVEDFAAALTAICGGRKVAAVRGAVFAELDKVEGGKAKKELAARILTLAGSLSTFLDEYYPGDAHTLGEKITDLMLSLVSGSSSPVINLATNLGKIKIEDIKPAFDTIGLKKKGLVEKVLSEPNIDLIDVKDSAAMIKTARSAVEKKQDEDWNKIFSKVMRNAAIHLEEGRGIKTFHDYLSQACKAFADMDADKEIDSSHPIFMSGSMGNLIEREFSLNDGNYLARIPLEKGDVMSMEEDMKNCLISGNYSEKQGDGRLILVGVMDLLTNSWIAVFE
jgi:hypothetical protein